jgi:hypothetical protein
VVVVDASLLAGTFYGQVVRLFLDHERWSLIPHESLDGTPGQLSFRRSVLRNLADSRTPDLESSGTAPLAISLRPYSVPDGCRWYSRPKVALGRYQPGPVDEFT